MKTLTCLAVLLAVSGCSKNQPVEQKAPPLPFPPGEYVFKNTSPVGGTEDSLILAVKSVDRKDDDSLRTLKDEGLVFNLPRGTRIVLLPANVDGAELPTSVMGHVDGMMICQGKIESGKYIDTDVAVPCDSLSP